MRLGALRHRIDIEVQTSSQDALTGEITKTWAPVVQSLPANVTFLSMREYISAQAAQTDIVARIQIRFRDDVRGSMRVVYSGDRYEIKSVLPDPRSGREWLTLAVTGGASV